MTTPSRTTLLNLVQAVSECAASDDEIVATVAYLINRGRVRLCGTFAGARIDLSAPAYAAPLSPHSTMDTPEGSCHSGAARRNTLLTGEVHSGQVRAGSEVIQTGGSPREEELPYGPAHQESPPESEGGRCPPCPTLILPKGTDSSFPPATRAVVSAARTNLRLFCSFSS